jgi:short-subunit dehydrogenase
MHAYDFLQRYGPTALVTGASSGIGEAFAVLLARGGFDLVLAARRTDRMDQLAARLRDHEGVKVSICQVDLSRAEAIDTIAAACDDRDIGLLVSNAGFGMKGAHQHNDPIMLRNMVNVNCVAPMLLSQHFIPKLVNRGRGGIIITSSVESLMGFPYSAPYAASKAFASSLGEGLWGELQPLGVDVLALCPGSTDTETHALQGIDSSKLEGMMSAEAVAREALDNIQNGPVFVSGDANREMFGAVTAMPRREALLMMAENMKQVLESEGND